MQIPSGVLSERFGPRYMIFTGMLIVSILTILSPFLARGSPYLLIGTRALLGIGEVRKSCLAYLYTIFYSSGKFLTVELNKIYLLQATMYPGAQVFWSKWSPPHERSRLVAFAFGGECKH